MNNNALAQAPVTYNFTTDVPGFTGGCPACLFVGQPVSGSFVYNSDADFLGTNPQGLSIYLGAISNWSGSVGNNSFSDDLGLTVVGNDFVAGTRDLLNFTPGLFLEGFEIGGYTLVDVRMLWLEGMFGDPAGNPDFLLDQNLPAELPAFPGFLLLDFENPLNPGIIFTVNFTNLRVTLAPTIVTIDIKPGESSNTINPTSRGIIPVAILTTNSFDATQLDFETVVFGPNAATESHGRAHVTDIDEDGDVDLILHFDTQDAGIQCGETEATLIGETFDGQAITGFDAVRTVPCPAPEI